VLSAAQARGHKMRTGRVGLVAQSSSSAYAMTIPKKAGTALDETNRVSGEFVRREAAWRNWIRNGK
jgi:hypothetical protein